MYACLGVTDHLHFWQSDRGLLRATVVTRGLERTQNESAQKVNSGEEHSPATPAGTRTHNRSVTSPTLLLTSYLSSWGVGNRQLIELVFREPSEQHTNVIVSKLVSWCFKPSQPQRIISGLISPGVIPCGWLGLKHQLTNELAIRARGNFRREVYSWKDQ